MFLNLKQPMAADNGNDSWFHSLLISLISKIVFLNLKQPVQGCHIT